MGSGRAVSSRPLSAFSLQTRRMLRLSETKSRKEKHTMGMGVSLLLVAVGAVLVWAVNATVSGIEIHTIGWILLAVGAFGAFLSLVFWSSWGGFGGPADGPRGRRTVVREDY
jgi:Na+/proline symporter